MSLFEIRLKALSGEELAQFLPGMLVSELFYAELPALHMKIPEKSGITLTNFIFLASDMVLIRSLFRKW